MSSEKMKGDVDKAIQEAVKSVDEKLGGANERSVDKAFLARLHKQIMERKAEGKGLTHEDLSEGEQARLQKIAEFATGLTDEELNTLAALGLPKKNE